MPRSDRTATKSLRLCREQGAALLFVLLGVVIALTLSGALVFSTVSESRAVDASTRMLQAFYVAEAGLQTAKWELGADEDPQGDGKGAVTGVVDDESGYSVAAVDLGSGLFRLTASGTVSDDQVSIEEVVEIVTTSRFPGGAISVVGEQQISQIQTNSNTDLLIDGGTSPGIVTTHEKTYEDIGGKFAMSVKAGDMDESDLVGSITNQFDPGDVDISVAHLPQEEAAISITSDMFKDLRDTVQNVWLPSATSTSLPSSSVSYGTAVAPTKRKFATGTKVKGGQTVSGFGTLLFNKDFVVENGGKLNWDGNIIIYSDDKNDALLEIDGTVNVTGNILILSGKDRNAKFELKALGNVTVNGALTVVTDYSNPATKVEFYVENNLTVHGLITSVAPKQQVEFKPGSDVYLEGSFQVGRMLEVEQSTEFKFKFEEKAEFYKDDDAIMDGANALVRLGGSLGTKILDRMITQGDVATRSWRRLVEE